jgi:4-amino-4-deoxy-L-arabinose transferase-like glycosyltransferase
MMNNITFRFWRHIERLSTRRLIVIIVVAAAASSLLFSTLVYPRIAAPLNSTIAEDGYDKLAYGLFRLGTFTYFPSEVPTVLRGPAYPAFVAGILYLGEGFYPLSVQIAQAGVHAATAVLCFIIGMMLWNSRRASTIAALVCSVHPFLLWYTARIVTETLATFLFTAFIAALLWYNGQRTTARVALAGLLGGLAALCKQTFLPLPFLAAAFIVLRQKNERRFVHALVMVCTTVALVLPWTIRNYHVSNKVIPVHALMGYNFRVGDALAEHYFEAPMSYMTLVALGKPWQIGGDTITQKALHDAERLGDFSVEERILRASLDRYAADPMFLLRKLLLGLVMFWTISGSPTATAVTSALQIPLLVLTVLGGSKLFRRQGMLSLTTLPLWLMAFYMLSHLPIYSIARFGLVLVPAMLAYAAGVWRENAVESLSPSGHED